MWLSQKKKKKKKRIKRSRLLGQEVTCGACLQQETHNSLQSNLLCVLGSVIHTVRNTGQFFSQRISLITRHPQAQSLLMYFLYMIVAVLN